MRRSSKRMRSADVLVFPSVRDFGGGVVFEALACGAVPVVADFGGPGDIVHPEVGYKVPLTNEDDLVAQMEKALDGTRARPEPARTIAAARHGLRAGTPDLGCESTGHYAESSSGSCSADQSRICTAKRAGCRGSLPAWEPRPMCWEPRVRVRCQRRLMPERTVRLSLMPEMIQPLLDTCYSLQRSWWRHWPLRRGKGLPMALAKRISGRPVWVELEPHIKMLLDPSDLISNVLLLTGEWEPGEQTIIQQYLAPGGTFVDIGAHIGYCSLRAATLVGPNGRVIAIEANPETIRKLRDNVAASGANVTVEAAACSDSETTLEFFAGSQTNSGSGSISKDNAGSWGALSASIASRRDLSTPSLKRPKYREWTW